MAPSVFYVDRLPASGQRTVLEGAEGRHAATVRRIGVGERLLLGDGHGGIADCQVAGVGRDRLELAVLATRTMDPPVPEVILVQALAKGERSELAVELATEAGIDAVVPWQAARCIARWRSGNSEKADKGVAKWRAAAYSAAKQSRRAFVPEVAPLHSTSDLVRRVRDSRSAGGRVLVLHEGAAERLDECDLTDVRSITLVVGPEGGIDDAELEALTAAGATAVRLGPTVLRTSTAAAVALGALGALTPRWALGPLTDRPVD